jgi:hypothetical protein
MARTSFTHWNVARLPRSVKTLEVAMQSTGGLELNNATITSDVTNSGTISPGGIVLRQYHHRRDRARPRRLRSATSFFATHQRPPHPRKSSE